MHQYPFTAIVGQPLLKQALLLCAVNPSIGGLLIKGEKGTAKSTAVRGLSAVLPPMMRISGSVFNSTETEWLNSERGQLNYSLEECPIPLVNLPLGASEDRVLGSLDLEAILSEKKKRLQPGLLAQAHRGILYIDEVNLLSDHLVDIILDVSTSGINTIQREGLSASHPSRFVMIGTMNPEEGNLRPQFLDRFGMMVEVESHLEITERTEVVRRRIAFEHDPEGFCQQWEPTQQKLRQQIDTAQKRLSMVQMPEGLLSLMSQLCIERSVASLRADIVLYKTAIALAAWRDKSEVTPEEVRDAAALVLAHRQGKKSQKSTEQQRQDASSGATQQSSLEPNIANSKADSSPQEKSPEEPAGDTSMSPQSASNHEKDSTGKDESTTKKGKEGTSDQTQESTVGSSPLMLRPELPETGTQTQAAHQPGRRSKAANTRIGYEVKSQHGHGELAILATVQEAILRDPEVFQVKPEDLRHKVRHGQAGSLILFVVDASGSMAVQKRMALVKGSVMALLQDAYEKRDRVGVITFRGVEAQWVLQPTNQIDDAEAILENLATGGRTPLAGALQLALEALKENESGGNSFMVCLSDGKGNVPLPGGGDSWRQTLALAMEIASLKIPALVVDTENGYLRLGRASVLAEALGAECLALDDLNAGQIHAHIQQFNNALTMEKS